MGGVGINRASCPPGSYCLDGKDLRCGSGFRGVGFRGGLVFKAHRLFYHSTLGSRVMKKKQFRGFWFYTSKGVAGGNLRVA